MDRYHNGVRSILGTQYYSQNDDSSLSTCTHSVHNINRELKYTASTYYLRCLKHEHRYQYGIIIVGISKL